MTDQPPPHICMEGYWPVPCDSRCPERPDPDSRKDDR